MQLVTIDSTLLLVFFIYGLAFYSLGITLFIESGRFPVLANAKVLRPLAFFGLIHGTHEWLEAYLLQAEGLGIHYPGWMAWVRLTLLISSFFFLVVFGIQAFRSHPAKYRQGSFLLFCGLGAYFLFILINAIQAIRSANIAWLPLLDVLSRYLLAVPGAMLAAFALRVQAVESSGEDRPHLITHLTIAAVGFLIYGLAQLFVPNVDMFPARVVNVAAFRTWLGFPIQIIRSAMAVMITLGMVRSMQLAERERQRLATAAQEEHLEALEQRDNLRHELLAHTVQAQEEERARIARELHDETAQVLTAFSLDLATLRNKTLNDPQYKQVVERLQQLSKQMSLSLYRLVLDLRPAQLDDLGLIPAIHYLKDSVASQGLDVCVEVQGQSRRVDATKETVLFRVVQEALNNVLRHARTSQAQVLVQYQTDEIQVKVIDNGIGFDPDLPLVPPHGWGLAGMRERVELIGGKLQIHSAGHTGTSVVVTVPDSPISETARRGS
jgi:signal transduction histidine kinase